MIGRNLAAGRNSSIELGFTRREKGAACLPVLEAIEERSGFHEERACGARTRTRTRARAKRCGCGKAARTRYLKRGGRSHAETYDCAVVCRQDEGCVQMRARYNGICHLGRCFGGDSHRCDNGVSAESARALGRHSNGDQQSVTADGAGLQLAMGFRLAASLQLAASAFAQGVHVHRRGQALTRRAFARRVSPSRMHGVLRHCAQGVWPQTHIVCKRGSESGQGTIEYALVMFGFLSIVAGLGALWNMLGDGLLATHALVSASHHVQAVAPGAVADVFAF